MRSPRPSTARRTLSAVDSSACSGWYPTGTKRVTIPPIAQMPRLVFRSLAIGVSPFVGIDGPALVDRPVQRRDHARLRDGVVAVEQRRRLAAHGRLEVLQLERVGVHPPRLDALDRAVGAPHLDLRAAA